MMLKSQFQPLYAPAADYMVAKGVLLLLDAQIANSMREREMRGEKFATTAINGTRSRVECNVVVVVAAPVYKQPAAFGPPLTTTMIIMYHRRQV